MTEFSFIHHPVENMHRIIPSLMPGIERILTIHYDDTRKEIIGLVTNREDREYKTAIMDITKSLPVLQKFMDDKTPFNWYNKNHLPFSVAKSENNPSLDIFTELQNNVLLIRLPDELNQFKDLIFLYLNSNPSNFGVTNTINPLTTDNKSIIAFFMFNTLKTIAEEQRSNKNALKFSTSRTISVIDKAEELRHQMDRAKNNYGLSLVKLSQQYIHEMGLQNRRKYKLSAGAIEKIKNFQGELKDIELIIKEAIIYIESLFFDVSDEIEILDWYLQFARTEKQFTPAESAEIKNDKYAKTINMLDKYEQAALVVKSRDMKMTGTNLGRSCPVPISAPAITGSITVHGNKINSLFKMFPEKWPILRSEFKPVKNLADKTQPSA
jgi:hypothetical protein